MSSFVKFATGAGLSSSAGYDFGGERLQKYFGDFVEKYGLAFTLLADPERKVIEA